jgi:hypothetical protein
VYNTQ